MATIDTFFCIFKKGQKMSFHPLTGTPLSFLTGLIFVKSITLPVNTVFMFL